MKETEMANASTKAQINFELVSPEARLVSEPVDMAVIPGMDGEMGVGAGHASFVVALKPGIVKLYQNGNATPRKIFVSGGFADITGENCSVLAEDAANIEDLNKAALEQDLKKFQHDLDIAVEATDKARYTQKIKAIKTKLAFVA